MLKRIAAVFILGACVFGLRGSVVEAHLAGTVYSPVYRHIASYDCTGTFKQVPNLSAHPAQFKCLAVIKEFEVLCENPQGKLNFGNSGPRTVTQGASGNMTQTLTEKKKGRATTTLTLPNSGLESVGQTVCEERNRNWNFHDELVTLVNVTIGSFACLNDACTQTEQAFEAELECKRPLCPNGQPCSLLDNPPPATPWDYDCRLLSEAHCDKGDDCLNPF